MLDQRGVRALLPQSRARAIRELAGERVQFGDQRRAQRFLDRLLPHRRLIGETHAIGGQYASVRMDENRLHPKSVGDQAGVLSSGASETLQGEPGNIVALLYRDLLDRVRHVGDGNSKESFSDGTRTALFTGRTGNLVG